jgi:hypothetical protein
MKSFLLTDEQGFEYQVLQKTHKEEEPIVCDNCDKLIKKNMYYCESDALDYYCLECCKIEEVPK